ncbi:DUF421 domain-containing protein [Fulvivirga ligni]|uniref:DUF421 domain-containing protein n=1 Tax=Fulvivirga ligni TaxID=2904246 RepID=UPI001F2933B3|nr:YetF domain-containing protein [Fulvivirga ligni]UII21320.1 DUF421 domain-containing protein [Fulvivirga ligni]
MKVFEDLSWLYSERYDILVTIFSTIIIYAIVIIITRINGLRTFAKMSSFDFAITIAIGSVIASTMLLPKQSVVKGAIGLVVLIALQYIVARMRKKSAVFENAVTNTPVLLMDGNHILTENLKATRVTEADLYAKLREANVTNKDQVLAVVLETTGDISVLHSGATSSTLDPDLLRGVQKKL